MSAFDLLSGTGATSSSSGSSGDVAAPKRPLTPLIFAGPGSNLYPLCDPYSTSATDSLPKALLPLANRPLVAFPLQHLVTAGFKHAILLAPQNQHRAIEAALRTIRLHVPGSSSNSSAGSSQASSASNIVVVDGTAPASAAAFKAKGADIATAAICVELMPLGPYDGKTLEEAQTVRGDFRPVTRPGTAELLRWLATIGKLESDPLIMPLDFLAASLPLTSFLLSYYSCCDPAPPTVATLLYERGGGESVGREREKEGPAKVLAAYAHTSPLQTRPSSSTSTSNPSILPTHPLLLLSEAPSEASSALEVRSSLLQRHSRARFTMGLLDSHIYILRKSAIVPLLNSRKDFTSLREHVIPFVAKAIWQKGLAQKAGWQPNGSEDDEAGAPGTTDFDDYGAAGMDEADPSRGGAALMRLAFERSSLARPSASSESGEEMVRAIACIARLRPNGQSELAKGGKDSSSSKHQQQSRGQRGDAGASKTSSAEEAEESFLARANTLPTFLECNRFLVRALYSAGQSQRPLPFPLPLVLPPSTTSAGSGQRNDISASAQLSPDSLVAENAAVKVGDRSSLKRCILGPRVAIGRNVRLSGCVLLEGATVGDGVKMDGCILGPKSRVADRVTLKDSDVGYAGVVKRDGKGEKITREEDGDEDGEDEDEEDGDGQ